MTDVSPVDPDMTTIFDEHRKPAIRARRELKPGTGSWIARFVGEFIDTLGATRPADYPPGPCYKMMAYLEAEPSLVEIQTQVLALPHGWAGPADNHIQNKEEVGQIGALIAIESFSAWRPALLSLGVPASEYDEWMEETRVDLQTLRCKTYLNFHLWCATVRPQT